MNPPERNVLPWRKWLFRNLTAKDATGAAMGAAGPHLEHSGRRS
jgi:hypothetical protein